MSLEYKIPTLSDLMEISLARFVTLAENDCGYELTTKEFIVNWVHPLSLKARSEDSKEYNPNRYQAKNGPFAD